jgi:hypothetical protein
MNLARALAAAAFIAASFPLLAQQAASPTPQSAQEQQASPQQSVPEASAPQESVTSASATLSSVQGELVDPLDTKTAKTGDAVVIKTQSGIKTSDGTEIPKGSKLVGRVAGVKPIGQGSQNSQVALQFDHAELGSGQKVPIHAEIQELSASDSGTSAGAMGVPPASSATTGAASQNGGMNGSNAAAATPAPQPQSQMSNESPASPAPGTIVARTGNIAIRATSIPNVLLATNAPGQQDPRMAQSSGILLGPQHDIHLDSGTHVVMGVSVASAGGPGGQ